MLQNVPLATTVPDISTSLGRVKKVYYDWLLCSMVKERFPVTSNPKNQGKIYCLEIYSNVSFLYGFCRKKGRRATIRKMTLP